MKEGSIAEKYLTPNQEQWSGGWRHCAGQVGGRPCTGVAAADDLCVAHLDPEQAEHHLRSQLKKRTLDLRGVTVDSELFALIDKLVTPWMSSDIPLDLSFTAATFRSPVDFFGWNFSGNTRFHATWFQGPVTFGGAVFGETVCFEGAVFVADVNFDNTTFESSLGLDGARFGGNANFYRARFRGPVSLEGALFLGDLVLTESSCRGSQWLGPFACLGRVDVDRAVFNGALNLEVLGGVMNLDSTRFGETVSLRLRWTTIELEAVVLMGPALLASAEKFRELADFEHVAEVWAKGYASGSEQVRASPLPRIESLRHTNVETLTLANVDLRACRFAGVRNLDRLRIDGDAYFVPSPRGRARRRVIAEEHVWRQRRQLGRPRARRPRGDWARPAVPKPRRDRPPRWGPVECNVPTSSLGFVFVGPRQLAATYRGLRKSLEDSKDTPGAADFYFGEMEMRRLGRDTPTAERWLLFGYWLLSGYGLRATRSLFALLLVVLGFGLILYEFGFSEPHSFVEGLLTSMRGAVLLPYGATPKLTEIGEASQIALRILGPLLAGLTLLAIRARIKR